ncbi:CARDB domain-containing protein [Chloroflexota bacterium]
MLNIVQTMKIKISGNYSLFRYARNILLVVCILLAGCASSLPGNGCLSVFGVTSARAHGLEHPSGSTLRVNPQISVSGDTASVGVSYASDPLPDLTFDSVTWSPENPSKNEIVTITAVVRNQGDLMSLPTQLNLYLDGNYKEQKLIKNLDPGEAVTMVFQWTALQGTHLIKLIADGDETIPESDETNNEETISISPVAPDLVVDSITWTPSDPLVGANITFSVVVSNQGPGTADVSLGYAYIDNDKISDLSFGAISSGETANTSFSWFAETGFHNVGITIDPNNTIVEINDNNNTKTVDFVPIIPDLYISSISWSPENPSVGETVNITATVGNQGRDSANSVRIHVFIGDTYSVAAIIPAIAENATVTSIVQMEALAGQHPVRVIVDPFFNITEIVEDNNELVSTTFLTSKSPDISVDTIRWSPVKAAPGETLTFTATIRNRGYGDASLSYVAFYVDDVRLYITDIIALSQGTFTTVDFAWTVEEGTHTFRCEADVKNDIQEINEDNNSAEVIYPVPADLFIRSITVSPSVPTETDNISFSITIGNGGDTVAEITSVACYIDDVYVTHLPGSPLEPGNTGNISFFWDFTAGSYSLKVIADPLFKLTEVSEENNEKTLVFEVFEADSASENVETENPDSGGSITQPEVPVPVIEEEVDNSKLWFFAIMGTGVLILLSFVFMEYRRRRS